MRDLDDFVTRARAENSDHHQRHVVSMEGLSGTVENSFSNISHQFTETFDRVRDLGEEVQTDTKSLEATLAPLGENICRPLSNLRDDINNTVLREYEPTGDTPQKLKYEYPTTLPRTEPHEVLLAGLQDDLPPPTPTKLGAMSTVPTIFNDLDMLPPLSTDRSHSPPPGSLPHLHLHRNPSDMSLREVNPNLTTGSIMMFDPSASTMSMPPPANENKTLPLFKRSVSGMKAPTRATRRTQTTGALGEGRENVPPAGTGMGGSRRKSPRLN